MSQFSRCDTRHSSTNGFVSPSSSVSLKMKNGECFNRYKILFLTAGREERQAVPKTPKTYVKIHFLDIVINFTVHPCGNCLWIFISTRNGADGLVYFSTLGASVLFWCCVLHACTSAAHLE